MAYRLPEHCEWNTRLNTPCPILMPCPGCKALLPVTSFSTMKCQKTSRKDILGNSKISRCKKCVVKEAMSRPLERRLWQAAKQRAKKRGLPFDIEVSDIVIPERCPILGMPIKPQVGVGAVAIPERNYSPSLDRIDNKKGYVKGNIAVISMRANHVKADGTFEELIAIAEFVKAHMKQLEDFAS